MMSPPQSFGEGNGNSLQDTCLEKPMDRGAWQAIVHGLAESDKTQRLNHQHHLKVWFTKQNAGLLSGTGQLHLRKPIQMLKISGKKHIHNRKNQPGVQLNRQSK